MTRTALLALLSHWRRHPGQLLALLAGLALATALWSAVQAINAEARASYDRASGALGLSGYDRLEAAEGDLSIEDFVRLRRAGWAVSPVLEGRIAARGGPPIRVQGIEFLTAPPGLLPPGLAPLGEDEAPVDLFTGAGIGFVAPSLLARLEGLPDSPRFRADAAVAPGEIITDIAVAERLLAQPGTLTALVVLPDQPMGRPPLSELAPDLILRGASPDDEAARLTGSFHLNLTAFGLLAFGVGLFITHGAIGLAFEQRRGTIRTLRALGLPARRLVVLLLVELIALALIAGAAGLALGYAIAAALLPDVAATLRGLYGAEVPGVLSFRPDWALAGMAMALAGALAAAAQGLWRVMAMPLLASARPRAWATVSARALNQQAAIGLLLIAIGLITPLLADGLVAGFALLAGLLTGAALLLPRLLALILGSAATRAQAPLTQWFWADTRQQLPGLSLALMALLLALAANIGVSTMVGSFRLTFTGWLDQRLAADLYLSTANAAEADALSRWAEAEGLALLPRASAETRLAGAPGSVEGIADHPIYRENWPLLAALPDAWQALARGEATLINEQLARRAGLSLGDDVELAPGWVLPVAGIYSDYGNPRGQAFTALSALSSAFPGTEPRDFGLLLPPDTTVEDLKTGVISGTGLTEANMIDQAAVKAISLQIFERTFAVTGALNVLTLGVAGIALLIALSTLAAMRLPQLAPVWALGLTRTALAQAELIRAVLLAALTFAAALPLGLATAWALLAVVNVEAFGWRLPMHVFPGGWATLLALSLLAALAAAALPARRLARTPPATLLKVFADDR